VSTLKYIGFTEINHRLSRRADNHPVEQIVDPVVAQLCFAFVANVAPHAHAGKLGGYSPPRCTRHKPPLSIGPAVSVRHRADSTGAEAFGANGVRLREVLDGHRAQVIAVHEQRRAT
jgi:hypothetical protein